MSRQNVLYSELFLINKMKFYWLSY